jgi:hypothetical protein
MPIATGKFQRFVDKVFYDQDEFSKFTPEFMARQIRELRNLIKDIAIAPGPTGELIERMDSDEYAQFKSTEFEPRAIRAQMIDSLDTLNRRVLDQEGEKEVSPAYSQVRVQEIAANALEQLVPYDVDPQRFPAFSQTPEGQRAIGLASRTAGQAHPREIKAWREMFQSEINQSLVTEFWPHLERNLKNADGEPVSLSLRDLLYLMRDFVNYENTVDLQGMDQMPGKMVAMAKKLRDDYKCELPQSPIFSEGFWASAVGNGLEKSLDSYSNLTEGEFCRDRITPAQVLRQLDASDKLPRHRNGVVVSYFDNARPAILDTFGKKDYGDHAFVMREEPGAEPFVVRQMHPGIPDTFIVTANQANHKILDLSALEATDSDTIWNHLVKAAHSLESVTRNTVVAENLKNLHFEYRTLDPHADDLGQERSRLTQELVTLAKQVPPPRFGDLLDLQNRRDITTMGILLGAENAEIKFQTPSHMNNKASGYFPDYEIVRHDAGDDKVDIQLVPIRFNGFQVVDSNDPIVAMTRNPDTIEMKGVRIDDQNKTVGNTLREHSISDVARRVSDSWVTFKMDNGCEWHTTGYWASPAAENEATRFTVAQLAGEKLYGEKLFNHPREDQQVDTLSRDLVAKIFGASDASTPEWREAQSEFLENRILAIPTTDTAISVSEMALRVLDENDLTSYVNHAFSFTSLEPELKQMAVDLNNNTPWSAAENMSDTLNAEFTTTQRL